MKCVQYAILYSLLNKQILDPFSRKLNSKISWDRHAAYLQRLLEEENVTNSATEMQKYQSKTIFNFVYNCFCRYREEKLFFGSVDTFVVCKQLSTQFIQKQTKVVEEVEATSRQDWRSSPSCSLYFKDKRYNLLLLWLMLLQSFSSLLLDSI